MEKRTQITPTADQKQDNKTQELVNARKDTLSKLKNEESNSKRTQSITSDDLF